MPNSAAEAAASDVVVLALPLGRIAELDPAWFDGRIVVDADGEQVVAAAGDVTHLRPE